MKLRLSRVHRFFQFVGLVLEAGGLGLDGLRLVFLAFTHQPPNLAGQGVALREHLVEFGLGGPSLGVQVQDLIHGRGGVDVTLGEGGQHAVALFSEALEGQHRCWSVLLKNKNSRPVGAGSSHAF